MRYVFAVVAVLALALLAVGQAPAPAGGAGRIVVVNADRVLTESNEGKAAQKDIEAKFLPRQKDLQARAAELEKLQTELQQKAASMPPAEQQRRAQDLQARQKSLERMNEDINADFQAAREEVLRRLSKRVSDVIQKLGADKGYALILDANGSGALYVSKGSDITDEVMSAFNAAPAR